jgi:hypothetical protein
MKQTLEPFATEAVYFRVPEDFAIYVLTPK